MKRDGDLHANKNNASPRRQWQGLYLKTRGCDGPVENRHGQWAVWKKCFRRNIPFEQDFFPHGKIENLVPHKKRSQQDSFGSCLFHPTILQIGNGGFDQNCPFFKIGDSDGVVGKSLEEKGTCRDRMDNDGDSQLEKLFGHFPVNDSGLKGGRPGLFKDPSNCSPGICQRFFLFGYVLVAFKRVADPLNLFPVVRVDGVEDLVGLGARGGKEETESKEGEQGHGRETMKALFRQNLGQSVKHHHVFCPESKEALSHENHRQAFNFSFPPLYCFSPWLRFPVNSGTFLNASHFQSFFLPSGRSAAW